MLEVRQLGVEVRGKHLIRSVSALFSPGTVHGLLGPNGSGKTTLLKTIAGIWPEFSGEIFWNNKNLFQMDRAAVSKIIAYVPQNPSIAFDYTVEEIIEMGRYPQGNRISLKEERDKLEEILYLTELCELRHQPIMRISGGERQRTYFARALAAESEVILLDEPTANLDLKHQFKIWKLLETLAAQKNKTLIIATHDLASARQYCHCVSVMDRGECAATGRFETIMVDPFLQKVFGISNLSFTHPFYLNCAK